MVNLYLSYSLGLLHRLGSRLDGEDGVETIEWIGMAAVVLVMLVAVASFMESGGGESVGQALVNALVNLIGGLAGN